MVNAMKMLETLEVFPSPGARSGSKASLAVLSFNPTLTCNFEFHAEAQGATEEKRPSTVIRVNQPPRTL